MSVSGTAIAKLPAPRTAHLCDLPLELIVEVFRNLDFDDRVRAARYICKELRGLLTVDALWRNIETSNIVSGQLLLELLQEIPAPSKKKVTIDGRFCSRKTTTLILKSLEKRGHKIISLTFTYSIAHGLRRIYKSQSPQLRDITELVVHGEKDKPYPHNVMWRTLYFRRLILIMNNMPNLTYLQHTWPADNKDIPSPLQKEDIEEIAFGSIFKNLSDWSSGIPRPLPMRFSPMKQIKLLGLAMNDWTLRRLGIYFPVLEVFEISTIHPICFDHDDGYGAYNEIVFPASLRSFHVYEWFPICPSVGVSSLFLKLIQTSQGLEELTLKAADSYRESAQMLFCSKKYLQIAGMHPVIESPKLREVTLVGWGIDISCMFGENRIWECPVIESAQLIRCRQVISGNFRAKKPDIDLGVWQWEFETAKCP